MIPTVEQMEQQARELALTHQPGPASAYSAVSVRRTFRRNLELLRDFAFELKTVEPSGLQPAEQWLLDHADYIEAEAFTVLAELAKRTAHRLPRLLPGAEPRILALCSDYMNKTDGALDEESFVRFLNAYQDVSVLTIAEAGTVPLWLRIAAMDGLARLMRGVRERRRSFTAVDKLLEPVLQGSRKPDAGRIKDALEAAGHSLPLSVPVVVHLISRLNEWADEAGEVREWLLCKLENGADSLNRITMYEHQLQASYEWMAGNLIQALRTVSRSRWDMLFGRVSVVERTLAEERAGTYTQMDATSRGTLRRQIERLAHGYAMPENVVAEQAVLLADRHFARHQAETGAGGGSEMTASESGVADADEGGTKDSEEGAAEGGGNNTGTGGGLLGRLPSRSCYAAYYLLEPAGQRLLLASLRECGKPRRLAGFRRERTETRSYITVLSVLFAGLLVLTLFGITSAGDGTRSVLVWLAAAILLLIPVSEWAVTIVHGLIGRLFTGKPLLRYDFSSGIAADAATMTVIPVIWSTPEEAESMADRLELHYLAGMDPHIGFALLGDYPDADSEHTAADGAIAEAAIARIEQLNRTYGNPETGEGPFYLFQRARKWNDSEQVWMGWERKRGKLVEFVELLGGRGDTSFSCLAGDCSRLARFRYVLTLDADTELPIGAAQRMIGTMHLPYNRARLNDEGTRIVEGYGVLQPRVGISYEAVASSRLARLWSGEPGIDPYSFAISDPYQDALGQGIFTGKGLFDIAAFRQVLNDRIPDNRVLSHDLLEGGFLRGGLLSDIEVVDGHPATFHSYQKRLHRWVRGDWQLLCWLAPRVSDRCGQKRPVDLALLTRWQIVDNLRRSLLQPALLLLLLGSLLISGGAGVALLVLGLATIGIPVIRAVLAPVRLARFPRTLPTTAAQALVLLIMLPYQAVLMTDAIIRTVYRLGVSKRKLLEWTSSAEIERRAHPSRSAILGMGGGIASAIVFAAAALFAAPPGLRTAGLVIAALWLLAPVAVRYLNGAPSVRSIGLQERERERLRLLAQNIWAYYEDYAGPADNWLPPDNVQMEPPNGAAHRTSPTNIGLMMACTLCARDFGFVDTPGMLDRLERTLTTIERMEKWHGHLYNWYDTVSLHPLPPVYVSTVDSGNFIAYLVALKQGVLEWGRRDDAPNRDGSLALRAERLAKRIEAVITNTDFRPLYDESAQLFALGYHVGLNRRENILYDLLASEARQASFLAIAFGQAPVSHWFKLGRAMVLSGRRPTLLSWSGTMFEYVMPSLLMRTYRQTVWDATYRGVIDRQIEYGRQRGVPFGISESGYYAFDYAMNYQYRAFGVPGLGFQRGLEHDLVLAPYAAIMALPFRPEESLASLSRMEAMGAVGKYGFYEAIDCTASRMPTDRSHVVIRSFMAHHLGMSLLTLGNMLLERTMIDRFHADKRVQAAELLLQERLPQRPAIIKHTATAQHERTYEPLAGTRVPLQQFTSQTETPEVCVLSGGAYTTVVSDSGGGFSRWEGLAVSRWHEDPVAESPGSCLYIRDVSTGDVWSPSFEPCRTKADESSVQFALDKAVFTRRDGQLATELEVCVPPGRSAELRRLTLTNHGEETRVVEVTSYTEIALAPPAADKAHPAFSKLFVQTEYDSREELLLAFRRPRDGKERTKWAVHGLSSGCESLGPLEYDTSRSAFIGRGHTLAAPAGLECRLSETVGAVLDPAFVMRRRVSIAPGGSVKLFAVTGAADSREEALAAAADFCGEQQAERAFQLAWTHSRIDLRHQHITAHEATEYHRMAARLLYQSPLRKEREAGIAAIRAGQSDLWPLGISGDLPIALVKLQDKSQMPFALMALSGHAYLRRKGIGFDLVFLLEAAGGYYQDMQEALRRAIEQTSDGAPTPGGIFPLTASTLTTEQLDLLSAVARLTLRADGPSFRAQLAPRSARRDKAEADLPQGELPTIEGLPPEFRLRPDSDPVPGRVPETEAGVGTVSSRELSASDPAALPKPDSLQLFNGWGGFAPDGREYRILLQGGKYLPAPWSNVMANPSFGTLVTELGTGYTWWRNSREFKLTPWSNDPVLDTPGEACYIRDDRSGEVWSASPAPTLGTCAFEVSHGFGYSQFAQRRRDVRHEMTVFVHRSEPLKIARLELKNEGDEPISLSVAYYCNWVLGVQRQENAPYVATEWDAGTNTLLAENHYQKTFRHATAFLHMFAEDDEWAGQTQAAEASQRGLSYTANRAEFIGRAGTIALPEGMRTERLSNRDGVFADSCGAIRMSLTVPPRTVRTVYALLGAGESKEAALELVRLHRTGASCDKALTEVQQFWRDLLGQIEVETPSRELNVMLNGWLLYQALSCRMWARTAFYQAGGAYGYRDQLQDSLALLHAAPELTRRQIVLHAAHQYEEGDVQHWWHEETGRGIRTKYTDDLLWLPYTVSHYVIHTGDVGVLDEIAPFLTSVELTAEEHERYEETVVSPQSASVYEHCLRAIERASRYGEHGIPLMGIGDWNDGMNSVGDEGKGESVWLGWFLIEVLRCFAPMCELKGDPELAGKYRERALQIGEAVNESAWDGAWYRRAYTDEGAWLGTVQGKECRIDAIAQSWSVISGAAPAERATQAMLSFDRELVDRALSVVRLLTPPFDTTEPNPGYIQGYPPGIRENGAQYTHGVIWSIVAWSKLGNGDKAFELFDMLNPVGHAKSPSDVRRYAGEPYVMAADVYTREPVAGRSGWTWYTGASGWMYQAGVEWILGLRREREKLYIRPSVPADWPSYSVRYRFGGALYRIEVFPSAADRSGADTPGSVVVDGNIAELEEAGDGLYVPLADDGREHEVIVTLPNARTGGAVKV
ncbi:GH36-type glycosyl hydrolase domain-containing protein [Paenibacillus ginsengarvi]|uniref:Glycosyl transferase family 36 n=1 Tax=Paenibacillus ginsengarvi TaxID=400777 RepID=A0A3B0C7F9_9BACL|nr:glucoamylase family protein [Paenibacillus ginsengarvi]RKN80484.1 glycosyl transferase family 36 [Paenibacillus ginsengarvi]